MMAINGWVGKILWVDLTSGDITEIPTTDYVPKFIGGRGVAAAIHFDNQGPEVGAFDPENLLFFMTGPLTGTPAPTAGRLEVLGKAAQTYPQESFTRSGIGGVLS
jgi:aldehyde:ferredoxin oxidoreductase